jgi:hypothetical protein
MMLLTCAVPGPIVPSSSSSPRCPSLRHCQTHVVPEPARLHCIIFCHFGPTNPDFDMLHCHIALICYIAFVLPHCFDVLDCYITLICCIAFNMSHCFDMLHYRIALICYIAFDTLHCFDMLHNAILFLLCYILIYTNAYYIAQ